MNCIKLLPYGSWRVRWLSIIPALISIFDDLITVLTLGMIKTDFQLPVLDWFLRVCEQDWDRKDGINDKST
jgi:hypothetical protein